MDFVLAEVDIIQRKMDLIDLRLEHEPNLTKTRAYDLLLQKQVLVNELEDWGRRVSAFNEEVSALADQTRHLREIAEQYLEDMDEDPPSCLGSTNSNPTPREDGHCYWLDRVLVSLGAPETKALNREPRH